jgi:hypothetical protein
MKIDLGKILTRAWQIIWNYKVLWIFGIFAGFANGGGGNGNNSSRTSGNDPSNFNGNPDNRIFEQISEFFQQYMVVIIAVCIVLLLLSLAFYALGMMGRIGILKGVYKVEGGATSLAFGELWSESMPYFWRFFWLNFVVGLATFVVVLLFLVPFFLFGAVTAGIGFLCLLPFLCLLIPLAWALGVVLEQAQAAIVAENLSMIDGFKRGWEIAKSDIGGMIVLSLVLGVGGFIIGIIIFLPIILAVLPVIFSAGNFQWGDPLPVGAWISLICCGLYFPILLGLNGIITAYMKTAWALSYLQLAAKPAENLPIPAQADA